MAESADTFRRVVDRLSKMTAPRYRTLPITEETEVYGDLRIYGDEIVDLVWWLEKEFGVSTDVNPFRYAPREFSLFRGMLAVTKLFGIEPRYESLKVRDLVAAIEAKRWP